MCSVFLWGAMMRSWAPLSSSLPKSSMRSEWHHSLINILCMYDNWDFAHNSLFYFSSAPVTPFSPLSSRTPWCSPSHSLKRETWEVWDSNALWGQAFWNTWFWLVYVVRSFLIMTINYIIDCEHFQICVHFVSLILLA